MTELTPLALKLRTAYHHLATTDRNGTRAWWNAVAKVAEAELASVAESATVRPIRLPTMEECHRAVADRYEQCWNLTADDYWDWYTSMVLDLVGSLNPTWVEVPPDATIPAGTLVRRESRESAVEYTTMSPTSGPYNGQWYVPSGTVLTTPLNPRVESVARAIHDAGKSEYIWDDEPASVRDNYVSTTSIILSILLPSRSSDSTCTKPKPVSKTVENRE